MKGWIYSASNFRYLSNDNITLNNLIEDGIHLNYNGTHIIAGNFADFIENFIFEEYSNFNNNKFWLGPVDPENVSIFNRGRTFNIKVLCNTTHSSLNTKCK